MNLPLHTPRLILRPFAEQDIVPFQEYRSDPEVEKYQGWSVPYTLEQAARFVDEMKAAVPGQPGEWYQIAIGLKPGGELIGDCAFQVLSGSLTQAEIGLTLARRYQGYGYAFEAITRLIDYLFGELNLHRIYANCDPENTASIRLLQKLGMRHEGRFVESLWFKGRWASEDWYAMLRREWESSPHRQSGQTGPDALDEAAESS